MSGFFNATIFLFIRLQSIIFNNMRLLFLTISFFISSSLSAQLVVSSGLTPLQYVTNNLIGPGVTISNVTFSGNSTQFGEYSDATSNIGFSSGIVMSSGDISELPGIGGDQTDGTSIIGGISDNDLLLTAQSVITNPDAALISSTEDAAILEFDFVAQSNIVTFNFAFGSDEYTTYINSSFNDAFGFFVSGPGITGPFSSPVGFPNGSQNFALVPGTNLPITISTIYPALFGNPGFNEQYYIDNEAGTSNVLNGFTTPIPITINVQCGETYHFKFAVADCEDNFLSTAVFLQDDSFTSPPVALSLVTENGTDTIPEACIDANVLFIRSACQSLLPLTINYTVSGTATDNVDFNIADSPIVLAVGQDTASINLIPILDNLVEGTESITITVNYLDPFGVPQTSEGTLYITDIPTFQSNAPDLTLNCFDSEIPVAVNLSGGTGEYFYDWISSSSVTNLDTVSVLQNGVFTFLVNVSDHCTDTIIDTVRITMANPVANISANILQGCSPLSVDFTNSSINGNLVQWNFGDGTVINPNNFSSQNHSFVASETVLMVVGNGTCSDTASLDIISGICGCTNPEATNYNSLAVVDDGSCILPIPSVLAPNVFTPSADGNNDLFELKLQNVSEVKLTILNRWGNVVFEATGPNPKWDGKSNGQLMSEGVYFYLYEAKNNAGLESSGQGFVQLFRK